MFASRTNWNLSLNRFTHALARLKSTSCQIFDLTISNPTACGLKHPDDLLAALNHEAAHHYLPEPKGLRSAREAVSQYYAELPRRVQVEPDDIILTSSTSEAYSFLLRLLCEPRDHILVPRPGYPLFDFLAGLNDVELRHYSLLYDYGWHMDLHALRQSLTPRTRAVAVVHPNNPTGSFVKEGEARELSAICAGHNMSLISDEVFLDYALEAGAETFAVNEGALTFTLSGLSKISGLPQMKLAWCVVSGPEKLKREAIERLEVISDTYLSINTPVQTAIAKFLEFRRQFQLQLRTRLSFNLQELDAQLGKQSNCSRLRLEGGWYAILRVPATRSDEELALELMEKESVVAHPGHFFDFPNDGYLIVSLITPGSTFTEGIRRLLRFLN